MKVALCISGFMRTFEETFESLDKHLLQRYDVDIFIHTWSIQDYKIVPVDYNKFVSLYQPKRWAVEAFHAVPETQTMIDKSFEQVNVNRVLSMYYKILQCNTLKSQYEKENNFNYDAVIRFRPDIRLEEDFKINPDTLEEINIPKFGDFSGLNDQVAYSNSNNMDLYSSLYNNIPNYIEEMEVFNSERFVKFHLEKMNLGVARFPLAYKLLCHGQVLDNETRERDYGFKQ